MFTASYGANKTLFSLNLDLALTERRFGFFFSVQVYQAVACLQRPREMIG